MDFLSHDEALAQRIRNELDGQPPPPRAKDWAAINQRAAKIHGAARHALESSSFGFHAMSDAEKAHMMETNEILASLPFQPFEGGRYEPESPLLPCSRDHVLPHERVMAEQPRHPSVTLLMVRK